MAGEKTIERHFVTQVKLLGGQSFKLPAVYVAGLPDRMALLPRGVVFFAELKTTGKKPTPIQKLIHKKIRALGFDVYVIDSIELVNETINKYKDYATK
jgi:hypothetical protein